MFRCSSCPAGFIRRRRWHKQFSISLSKFTESVQAAVKATVAKHPKFKLDVPNAVTVSYLIRGIPVPDAILSNVTLGETGGHLRRAQVPPLRRNRLPARHQDCADFAGGRRDAAAMHHPQRMPLVFSGGWSDLQTLPDNHHRQLRSIAPRYRLC